MIFRSIRTKTVLSVSLLLILVGIISIGSSYLFVQTTVTDLEKKSHSNILNLLYLFTDAKYKQMQETRDSTLTAIYKQGENLAISGYDILSVSYDLQLRGQLTEEAAKYTAFKLISRIDFDNAALAVLDSDGNVLATGDTEIESAVVQGIEGQLKRAKKNRVNAIIDLGTQLHGNIIYHPGWNLWICSLIDMSVIDMQNERQRKMIADALQKTFSHLKIAETGSAYLTQTGNSPNKPGRPGDFRQTREFKALGWKITITAPAEEIQKPARRLATWQGIIIAIGFFLAVLLIAFLIRTIAKPLIQLAEHAENLPETDLMPGPIDNLQKRQDEVGKLAGSFILMQKKLNTLISKLKQEKERIRILHKKLIKAQESERRKIALELHDNVVQELTGTFRKHEALGNKFPETKKMVDEHNQILQNSINSLRTVSHNLRPAGLERFGLIKTIREFCHDFRKETGMQVDFSVTGTEEDFKFDNDTNINLYRITQEAFSNTGKHAEATQISVRLVATYPVIILRIWDNGKGFDTEILKELESKHMGISSMSERATYLNEGRFSIESRFGKGTRIKTEFAV